MIIISLSKESKITYKDKIVYKDRVIYKDKIVYKDRIIYKEKKVKPTKKEVVVEEPIIDPEISPKKAEILRELFILESKKKKTKQDMDNIYTLKMVLPNIK